MEVADVGVLQKIKIMKEAVLEIQYNSFLYKMYGVWYLSSEN